MRMSGRVSAMPRILVTGSTGNVGRHVVDQLTAAGVPFRAMTRDPGAAGLPAHLDVVRGDLTVPESLGPCLQAIDTVFLVWVAPADAIPAALERIVKYARRIVYLTAPLKTPHPFFQQPNPSRAIAERLERWIEQSGLEWTFVRAGMFAGNARHFWGPQIRTGDVIRWPFLNAPTAPTDERDIATVAVRALCDDSHMGAECVVTGPQSLTQAEQIKTIGLAVGRSLHVEQMTPDEARSELLPVLGSPVFINMLLGAWEAALGQPAFVSSAFAELTGRAPRPFLEWATDYAAEFRAS
ncbi:MAG: NAD(P)H-binding protein [Gemmatimonadaceae bacterium]